MTKSMIKHDKPLFWSLLAVTALNLLPLWGLVYHRWSSLDLLLFFWVETLLIGCSTFLKILFNPRAANIFERIFVSGFFCLHYGLFNFAHAMAVLQISNDTPLEIAQNSHPLLLYSNVWHYFQTNWQWLLPQLIALQLVLLIADALSGKIGNINQEMRRPYIRIVLLHVAIIGGVIISSSYQNKAIFILLLLVVLKLGTELVLTLKER